MNSILLNDVVIPVHCPGNDVVNLLPIKFSITLQFLKIISLLKLKTNQIKYFFFYVYTNLELQDFLENKSISLDDFIVHVIMRAIFIFVNLKFHSFIEINY